MRCPACDATNPADAATCGQCGMKLPAEVRQREAIEALDALPADEEDSPRKAIRIRRPEIEPEDDPAYDDDAGDGGIGILIPGRNPKALAGYYLGIFSMVPAFGILLAPVAIILSVMGLRLANRQPEVRGKVHAVIGLICGIMSLTCWNPLVALAAYFLWGMG